MINVVDIVKKSSAITAAGIVGSVLNFAAGIYVARRLGPDSYGVVAIVSLWLTYSTLFRPGTFDGAQRDVIDALAQNDPARALRAQNSGVSAELAWGALPILVFGIAFCVVSNSVERFGFAVISLTYLGSTLARFLSSLHYAHRNFDVCARISVIRGVAGAVILVGLVSWFGARGVFVAAAVSEWLSVVLFLTAAPPLALFPRFVFSEVKALTLVGLPFALRALVYWGYRLVGQTSTAMALPLSDVAYFTFSASLVTFATRGIADFSGVLRPVLWTEIAQTQSTSHPGLGTVRITVGTALVAAILTNLGQASFAPLILAFVPKYAPAVSVFDILAFNMYLLSIVLVPILVLDSRRINGQWVNLAVCAVALLVNGFANYIALRFRRGIVGIAWNDIWVQFAVVLALFALTHRYLFTSHLAAWRLYRSLLFIGGYAIIVFAILRCPLLAFDPRAGAARSVALTITRCGAVGAAWAVLLALVPNRRSIWQCLGRGPKATHMAM